MTKDTFQLSLVQLDDYGPWTTTPEPRRETDLQALQSRIYADLADFVGGRDGYVFPGRYDNMTAVTNGIEPEAHRRFQELVRNRSPVTASVAVGSGETPVAALGAASEAMQAAGSAQDADRRECLVAPHDEAPSGPLSIAHFDVVDATGEYTDRVNAYDAELEVKRAVAELSAYMREEHGAVTSFVGGDNAIAVCPVLSPAAYDAAVAHVRDAASVDLRVGVGTGETARAAGIEAKHALERGRDTGQRVAAPDQVRADD